MYALGVMSKMHSMWLLNVFMEIHGHGALATEDLYERQDLLGKALMTSFAEMLDLPPDTFRQFFEGEAPEGPEGPEILKRPW